MLSFSDFQMFTTKSDSNVHFLNLNVTVHKFVPFINTLQLHRHGFSFLEKQYIHKTSQMLQHNELINSIAIN